MPVLSTGAGYEMNPVELRVGILLVLSGFTWLAIFWGRRFVAGSKRHAFQAAPLPSDSTTAVQVRLLVFSTADCRQCHTHQAPAVQQVRAAYGDLLTIEEIDAPATPDLASRYHILTVPSTVILDASGRARAVNYGFAPAAQLSTQIDAARNAEPALAG